jgi:hypothetical protein
MTTNSSQMLIDRSIQRSEWRALDDKTAVSAFCALHNTVPLIHSQVVKTDIS